MSDRISTRKLRAFELFGVSITEILLLFIMCLIVYTHFADQESQIAANIKDRKIDELQTLLGQANEEIEGLQGKISALNGERTKLARELEDLRQQYRDLAFVIREYLLPDGPLTPRVVSEALEQYGIAGKTQFKDRTQLIREIARLKGIIAELRTQIAALQSELDMKNAENADLHSEVGELRSKFPKASGKGTVYPRCIAPGATYAIEYLYRVLVREKGFEFIALWPETENGRYLNIPGIANIGRQRHVSSRQLAAFGNRVLRWQNKQSPPCRFFVDIYPARPVDAKFFLDVRRVEGYFFKNENIKRFEK